MGRYDWVTGSYDRVAGGVKSAARAADRAFDSGLAPFDEPGEEIKVSPFRPGEVTAEAGIIKAITRLAAGRRAAANQRVKNETLAAARAKTALETEVLQQRIDAGTRTARKLPDGRTVDMTPAEWAKYQAEAGPKPEKRVRIHGSIYAGYKGKLASAAPDPDSPGNFTVEASEFDNVQQDMARQQRANQFAATLKARAEASGQGANLSALNASLANAEREIALAGDKAEEQALAQELGRLPQFVTGPDGKPLKDADGNPTPYEPSAMEGYNANVAAKRARRMAEDAARARLQPQIDRWKHGINRLALNLNVFDEMLMQWDDEDAAEMAGSSN